MSEIKVDTLTGKTTANDITVTVGATATMSLEQGLAKVFCNLDGTGTIAVLKSLNVSSAVDDGTGLYDINFSNAFSDTDASHLTGKQLATSGGTDTAICYLRNLAYSASTIGVYGRSATTGSLTDLDRVYTASHGDLA